MMTMLRRHAEVRAARVRVVLARTRLGTVTSSLHVQAYAHPLTCIGMAGGVAFALGWLAKRPWRAVEVITLASMRVWPLATRLLAMARNFGAQ